MAEAVVQESRTARRGESTVRLLLVVALLALGGHALRQPVERPFADLTAALQRGDVDRVELVDRPLGATGTGFEVRWPGPFRERVSRYPVGASTGGVDPVLAAVRQAPRAVAVVTVPRTLPRSGWRPWGVLGLAVVLSVLALLLAGSDPTRATRWAWAWLSLTVPVGALAFLLLEPLPLWRGRSPVPRRGPLTGGWALLLGLAVSGVGRGVLPDLTGVLWAVGPG